MNCNYLNAVGLIVDIIGVIGLFFITTKEIEKLSSFHYFAPSNKADDEGNIDDMDAKVGRIIRDFNENIDKAKEENKKIRKKTLPFFIVIIIGFFLQLSASFCPNNSTNSDSNNNSTNKPNECHKHNKP